MASTLADAKRRVRGLLLGTRGVHGVGVRAADSAVVLYVDPDASAAELRRLAAAAAAPHDVIVVVEIPPVATKQTP